MNIIKAVIEARGIANPVQLCSLSSVGACDSVKGGKCHNISCFGVGVAVGAYSVELKPVV